jgi:hypothetical protein
MRSARSQSLLDHGVTNSDCFTPGRDIEVTFLTIQWHSHPPHIYLQYLWLLAVPA